MEPEAHVAAVLTNELTVLAGHLPADVDAIVGEFAETSLWQSRLKLGEASDEPNPFIGLILFLAIAHELPAATALATTWFSSPAEGRLARRVFSLVRPWLSISPERHEERARAFSLVRTAAEALESLRLVGEAAAAADVYLSADALVHNLYFASGALGTNKDHVAEAASEGFAEEAFSVLELLTEFKHPTIIHPIIQTLGHLSPSNPRTAFLLVERSITAGDAYTYDTLAADTTIALVERYLGEYRELVATVPDLLTGVRRVLDAFVQVGWPAAISVSYRLGDAFR